MNTASQPTTRITGAEALMRSLIAEGAEIVFGYPGGSIMPVYNALYDHSSEVRHVLTRHEQGAIHAAQGYARTAGRPGVVFTTSGPGATNLVTGLADALVDCTPLVVITGQVDSGLLGYDAFQETDVVGVTLPVSKWSCQIRRAEDVAPAVARAFHIASTGRPGPVILDFTQDAQNALVDYAHTPCSRIRSYRPWPEIDNEGVAQAARLLNQAERPLILAGHGVMISGAEEALRQLAEKSGAPVAATLLGLSTMPAGHPLYRGMAGMHGAMSVNVCTNRADLILAVGMRFDNRVTGRTSTYGRNARIVHIDIDDSEFGKNIRPDVAICGDARAVLEQMLPMVEQRSHAGWLKDFDAIDADERRLVINPELHPDGPQLSMGEVVSRVSAAVGEDAITVTDVGLNQMMAARYTRHSRTRSMLTSGGLGTMGFGLPAAIGAKMAAPDREVVLYVGDGGFQMTMQELGTIMEHGTGVKIVLLNNNFLGNVRQLQSVFYGGRFSATPLVNPDFRMLASSYGIPAEDVTCREELDDAVARLAAAKGPYLLNVQIPETDMVFPMTKASDDVDHIMTSLGQYYSD